MICLSKFLRKCSCGQVSARTEVKEVRSWWSCCGPCYWAKSWRTTRNRERGERERERVAVTGAWAGSALASGHPSFCDQPSPGAAFKVSPWGGRAQVCLCITRKLFMSSRITHNQGVGRDAIKVKFWGKGKYNSICSTSCKQVFLYNLYFMGEL